MSASERLMSIGIGGKTQPMHVYLGWSRVEALTDYILRNSGTIDVRDYNIPRITLLAANYAWPERYLLESSS